MGRSGKHAFKSQSREGLQYTYSTVHIYCSSFLYFLRLSASCFLALINGREDWTATTCDRVDWSVPICDRVDWTAPTCDREDWTVPTFDRVDWTIMPTCDRVDWTLPTCDREDYTMPTGDRGDGTIPNCDCIHWTMPTCGRVEWTVPTCNWVDSDARFGWEGTVDQQVLEGDVEVLACRSIGKIYCMFNITISTLSIQFRAKISYYSERLKG